MKRFIIILLSIYFSITLVQATNIATVNSDKTNFQEVDFNPYMRELQRRVKMNWNPPINESAKKTVIYMKIAKNGDLLEHKVHTSSGSKAMDEAALYAVKETPYRSLPSAFNGQYVQILLTFDFDKK
jgi:TonB family protein